MFKPTLFKAVLVSAGLFVAVGPASLDAQDWIPARYLTVDGYTVVDAAQCSSRTDCQRAADGRWLKPNYRSIDWGRFKAQATADLAEAAWEQADLF